MNQSFHCPNCGGPIDYKGEGELTVRCPFCNNSVIVPEELRTVKPAPEPAQTKASPDAATKPTDPVLNRLRDLANQSEDPGELRRIARVERRILRRQERDEARRQRRGNIGK
jgi:uncharacterized Zn finger protein (UPF0148 family)